jgi:hypothetical protein
VWVKYLRVKNGLLGGFEEVIGCSITLTRLQLPVGRCGHDERDRCREDKAELESNSSEE